MAKKKSGTSGVSIKKPPILFTRTQKIISEVGKVVEQPFMAYWTGPSGSVCHNDVFGFYELLSHLGSQDALMISLKSDGGSGEAALRIISLLRQYCQHLTCAIPLECASAATMMALGANQIQMGPLAYLTAVDTSLRHDLSPVDIDNDLVSVSQDELRRVIRLWKQIDDTSSTNPYDTLFKYVHPLVVGAVDRSSSLSVKICQEILSFHMTEAEGVERIAQHLNSAYPSHSYPITLREAREIGLNVEPLDVRLNELLLELSEIHSEMGQKALTDYDEFNYHSHEIVNILEVEGVQIFYQTDKDWHYRKEERRWASLHDHSAWHKLVADGHGGFEQSVLHVR